MNTPYWDPVPVPVPVPESALPAPVANEDHKMLHNPCKLCKLYPLPSTTCPTSANVTNLMCFASIKPKRTHGLGYPTIMWCWVMGCAKLSPAGQKLCQAPLLDIETQKFEVCVKVWSAVSKLLNLINIILNFGFRLGGIFENKMENPYPYIT